MLFRCLIKEWTFLLSFTIFIVSIIISILMHNFIILLISSIILIKTVLVIKKEKKILIDRYEKIHHKEG